MYLLYALGVAKITKPTALSQQRCDEILMTFKAITGSQLHHFVYEK